MRKIIVEEHFSAPGFAQYAASFTRHIEPAAAAALAARLEAFDVHLLREMDAAGVEYAIMSQTAPSVQAEGDGELAVRRARDSNDFLARRIEDKRARFGGFATLPLHDPQAAAAELTRCVRELGFHGALVNGHSRGIYYDAPQYDAFWEVLADLDVPLYLHPANVFTVPYAYTDHPELEGAIWGWGVETGTHALRLLFSGVFDRFPGVRIVLGHMGEALPFQRWRFDSRFAVYSHGRTLQQLPSAYFGRNIFITTSGVCSDAALLGAVGEMGADAVMFSVDYPYESVATAADWIDRLACDDALKEKLCYGNAKRFFRIP